MSLLKVYNSKLEIPFFSDILKNIPQSILLYLYIFQPPFISRTSYFFIELTIFLFFIFFKRSSFLTTFRLFKKEFLLFIVILYYVLIRDLIQGEEVFFFKTFLWFFQTFIFSILIVSFYDIKIIRYNKHPKIFSLLYWNVIIAGLISFFLLITPAFYDFYKSLIIEDKSIVYNIRIFRGYGISENLTFTYSYLLGSIAGYTLLIFNNKKYYIFFIPFLIMGVLFNARIGLLPIFFFLLILFSSKNILKNLFIFGGFSLITVSVFPLLGLSKYFEKNGDWILSFFLDMSNIFSSEKTYNAGSSLDVLINDFIVIPENIIELIFGRGINLFTTSVNGQFSDIGYITQLNYGGGVFLILLLLLLYINIRRLKFFFTGKYWFVLFFTFSILILNFKGSAFVSTPGSRFLYTLYIYMIVLGFRKMFNDKYCNEKNTLNSISSK